MEVGEADIEAGRTYDILNLDTGRWMTNLIYANDETGEWVGHALDDKGLPYVNPADRSRLVIVRGRNRLAITLRQPPPAVG